MHLLNIRTPSEILLEVEPELLSAVTVYAVIFCEETGEPDILQFWESIVSPDGRDGFMVQPMHFGLDNHFQYP